MKKITSHPSLKSVYYRVFIFFIVLPLLVVLAVALLILNKQFKRQAIENIKRAQENIRTELTADIEVMSMRLSHIIYTNNNEVITYAAGTDTDNVAVRNTFAQKLNKAGNLILEPVKDVVSVTFYMKDGRITFIRNEIHREQPQIKETSWYQAALAHPNSVYVGCFDTEAANDLYTGGKKDLFVLVFALSPNVTTDRSENLEMVTFYQTTGAGDTIKEYNREYLRGKNELGITRIVGPDGAVIFATEDTKLPGKGLTVVTTPLEINDIGWQIESYIETSRLMREFTDTAAWIMVVALFILLLAAYYSRYFLASIVKPIEEISSGLRQVEEGNLDMHIAPKGQYEVRSMIHQFNAMVRRLRALISEYEERVSRMEKKPADYLAALVKGEITPEEAAKASEEFFSEDYVLLALQIEGSPAGKAGTETAELLTGGFERNSRFASRCWLAEESPTRFVVFYRAAEEDYFDRLERMLEELQAEARRETGIVFSVCAGERGSGCGMFERLLEQIRDLCCVRYLYREDAIIDLAAHPEWSGQIAARSDSYRKLAEALYIADEKVLTDEREHLFDLIGTQERSEAELHIFAAIVAIGKRFEEDNRKFSEIFQQQFDYIERIQRLEDGRGLKLWLTNYFAWIMDYSAAKLNLLETDVVVRAKRYLLVHYEEPDLSLAKVAEYVGLNEKYFTNKFTKEAGETFSSYLTGLRIQKAKELLRTTTFKVYEIAEMVGYHNTEHFNRTFKKLNGVSPAQYRKAI